MRIEGAVTELYDVAVLPGVRRPMAASFTGPEIAQPIEFRDMSRRAGRVQASVCRINTACCASQQK
jgi:hypothetical protein